VDYTIDRNSPTCLIASAVSGPTKVSPIPVTITFNKPVYGFTNASLTLLNATESNFAGADGDMVFYVDLTPTINDCTVRVDIAAGKAHDQGGNASLAAPSFSREYDAKPPVPDPLTWGEAAGALDSVRIRMLATEGADTHLPISYFFTNLTDGTVSDWQTSRGWTNAGLSENTRYEFLAKARDVLSNETAWAVTSQQVYTRILPPVSLTLTPDTNFMVLHAEGTLPNITNGQSGVLFNETNGFNAGINEWTTNTTDTATNLNPNTRYGYQAKARNGDGVETAYSSPVSNRYTLAALPLAPIGDTLGLTSIQVVLNAASTNGVYGPDGNPTNTQYAIGIYTNAGDTNYLTLTGDTTNAPVWAIYTDWGGINGVVVTNLDTYGRYTFMAMARNEELIPTPFGPPTVMSFLQVFIDGVAQTNDGSGLVRVNIRAFNPLTNDCRIRVEYGYAGNGQAQATNTAWLSTNDITASYGPTAMTNGQPYQFYDISTTNIYNSVAFWLDTQSASNIPALAGCETNVWLGIRIFDPADGKNNTESTNVWIDNFAPTCAVARAGGNPTNAAVVDFTVVFSEAVTNFIVSKIDLLTSGVNGVLANFGGAGSAYTVSVANVVGNGTIGIQVNSNRCTDLFGNSNAGIASVVYDIDQVNPTCAITKLGGNPTNAATVGFQIRFSEDMYGFTADGIALHIAGAVNGTVSGLSSGPGSNYTVNVSGISGTTGTVGISVLASNAFDIAGNGNRSSDTTSYYDIDMVRPTCVITRADPSPTCSNTVTFNVAFSESVYDLSLGAFMVLPTGPVVGTLNSLSGSGANYILEVSGITGNGTLAVSLAENKAHDEAGNYNQSATSEAYSIDKTPPLVTASSTASDPTREAPVPVTLTFSKAVYGFNATKVIVANATAYLVSGADGDLVYTIALTPLGQGRVTLDVPAGAALDHVGQPNIAMATQFNRIYDNVNPMVTMSSSTPNPTGLLPIPVTATFSEPVTGFIAGDVVVTNAVLSAFAGSGSNYTFMLTPFRPGQVSADIPSGVAVDAAGNPNDSAAQFVRLARSAIAYDFDGDRLADPWYYEKSSGMWFLLPSIFRDAEHDASLFGAYGMLAAPGDYDGDAKYDVSVYDPMASIWYIRQTNGVTTSVALGIGGGEPVQNDYDGDGRADIALYQEASGQWSVKPSGGGTPLIAYFGGPGFRPAPGDYDGDLKADLVVYQASTNSSGPSDQGRFYARLSSNNYVAVFTQLVGGAGYAPAPGDYDGDGKADPVIYSEQDGTWMACLSTGGYQPGMLQYGGMGMVSLSADYDGDGKTDVAVFKQDVMTWYILQSRDGYREAYWGDWTGAVPAPGDYNGDGITELAVYDPVGKWYIRTTDGQTVVWNYPFGGGIELDPMPGDYDGDGKTDLVLYQPTYGVWSARLSASGYKQESVFFGGQGYVPAPADYNGDLKTDPAVYNNTARQWLVYGERNLGWSWEGVKPIRGDFDGDGLEDCALYQLSSGVWYFMKSRDGYGALQFGGPGFNPIPEDFDGDRKIDMALYQQAGGLWLVLLSGSGNNLASMVMGGPEFHPAPEDYDGDRRADPVVYKPGVATGPETNGIWYACLSSSQYAMVSLVFGSTAEAAVSADYNGDGRVDPAVYQSVLGLWAVWYSATNISVISFGGTGFEPQKGDYDGDGKADYMLYQPSTGIWYARLSSRVNIELAMPFGAPGEAAVPGDYDGDGKDDLAMFNTGLTQWRINQTRDGYREQRWQWGSHGIPVPGDYDGDGLVDYTIYDEATGVWYSLFSKSQSFVAGSFGGPGYVPVPADFDGDGITDVALYHEETGHWTILSIQTGNVMQFQLGGPNAHPAVGDYNGDGLADATVMARNYLGVIWYIRYSPNGPNVQIVWGYDSEPHTLK